MSIKMLFIDMFAFGKRICLMDGLRQPRGFGQAAPKVIAQTMIAVLISADL